LASPFAFASPIPASVAALPFLFVRPQAEDAGWAVKAALASAAAAERADDTHRNTRARLAYLLCELGFQLGRRGADRDAFLPLPRAELAASLGTSLAKVKRTLALLSLSQAVHPEPARIRILDWPRLCALAQYDPARLGLDDGEPEARGQAEGEAAETSPVTAVGEPACFV
jgi:hypothetical protein